MQKIKCAIIGCGRISYKHVEGIANNDSEMELVAVCDIIEERAIEKRDEYLERFSDRDVKVYTDYKKMLEQIDQINKLADEKGLKVGVCHQNRFNPPIQKLKKTIDANKFGKMTNITARVLWNRNQNYYNLAPWRGTKALDGGTLMNQCIHALDLLLWMMDDELVSVKAETETFLRDIEMEDYGVILMRFKSGRIGLLEGSADVYPKNLEETISVFGSTGTAVIGGLAVNEIKTWVFEDESETGELEDDKSIDNVYGNGHTPLYKDFIHAINTDTQPLINGHEGRKPVEVLMKAYGWID